MHHTDVTLQYLHHSYNTNIIIGIGSRDILFHVEYS